ncbi:UNVERIFIED_CONTAM: putative B3 domain-containing protein [Sesamum radiatum]|uniref:B3 domain-containing protein n=1 Tax=Sesamum radiatum TaxID=300843 RepID=A0AAW2JD03_SESRA
MWDMRRPHFITGFDPSLCSERVNIPCNFIKHMEGRAPGLALLVGPSGNNWYVGLIIVDNGLFLNDGWADFVRDHFLEQGDSLVFRYDGNLHFTVQIFDLVPTSPNPFAILVEENIEQLVERNELVEQLQICILNQAANELLSPPENYYDLENEFIGDQEESSGEIISDHLSENMEPGRPTSPSSSLEDCTVRGKHTRSESFEENFQPGHSFDLHLKCKKRPGY